MIKGAPNAGDDRVKFTLEGGKCDTGAVFVGEPEFELKEWVVLFLVKSARPHIPADGYTVFRFDEGKRPCTRNRVPIWYTLNNGAIKIIDLPVDLVIQIAKAAAKDPEGSSAIGGRY